MTATTNKVAAAGHEGLNEVTEADASRQANAIAVKGLTGGYAITPSSQGRR